MRLPVVDESELQSKLQRPEDYCGVMGVIGTPEAAHLAYLGLYALQHRGQESAGIVAGDEENLFRIVGEGLVADVFSEESLQTLSGNMAVGHVRYATAGTDADKIRDAQPLLVQCAMGPITVAHNGNLTNAGQLRKKLEEQGSIFQTSSDTEVICHLIARGEGDSLLSRLCDALPQVEGAYSLVVAGDGKIYGVRDPLGIRPLVLGKGRGGYVLASETCAFDLIEAEFIREVEPGEVVILDGKHVESRSLTHQEEQRAHCVFEHVYFARPDSIVFGLPVFLSRQAMGVRLAQEAPVDADVVIPVPDSGIHAAMGFAREAMIPFEMGLVRNHYVGRTFIEPEQRIRNFGVRLKLNPVPLILKGKKVVVVDDSIVRGTTSRKIVEMIRGAGAAEVHLRISAPPTTSPCFFGIDTPTKEELIASKLDVEAIKEQLKCDSLGYLSREGLMIALGRTEGTPPENGYCDACFSGEYPIALADRASEARR
ncbi:MAG: amidophosphoribosyltransferase [Deltaproteobacteria bacterium]|nr:amidophosphoribosyltransferase [Deltaproteobacteria bacterium]